MTPNKTEIYQLPSASIFLKFTVRRKINKSIMKKSDLRASFDKIKPREELISSTIEKINEKKRKRDTRFVLPSFSFNPRLVGALCSLAIVFCIGFAVATQSIAPAPAARTIGQLETTANTTDATSLPAPSAGLDLPHGWILVSGEINNLSFDPLTDADIQGGVIRRCNVNLTADGLIARSDDLSADLDKTDSCLDATVLFYSDEKTNGFFDMSTSKMIFCLTPGENGKWIIVDFEPFEK